MTAQTQAPTAADTSVSRRAVLPAEPAAVFALLVSPREHVALDGSGLIKGVLDAPERLDLGSVFQMKMKG